MPWFLRQNTASQEVLLGPFVDDTDGKTAETALSIANTDIKVFKTGATSEASKNSGGATHIASGRYYCVLDATDTDTIGPLRLSVQVSGALPVWLECCVLGEAVYDSLFGTTALTTGDVMGRLGAPAGASVSSDIAKISGSVILRDSAATGGAAGSITLDSGASAVDNYYRGLAVLHVPTGQVRLITGYTGATKVATVSPNWVTNPANADAFRLLAWNAVNVEQIKATASAGAAGYVGVDWSAINASSTTLNLSGTTIATTQKVDVETIKTRAVTCSAGVTVGAFVGNATAALAVDASGRVDVGKWLGIAVEDDGGGRPVTSARKVYSAVESDFIDLRFSPARKGLMACMEETLDSQYAEYWPILSEDPGYIYTKAVDIGPNAINSTSIAANAITNAKIADGAITDAKIAVPAESSGRPTTVLGMLRRVFEWAANKRTRDSSTGTVLLRNAADNGTLETQTQSTAGTVDTQTKGA